MSLPREILPGRFYLITRRCVQQMFLLRPDRELDNAFLYCLIVAAIRTQIVLLHSVAMSNHHHTTIFDPYGRVPEFMEHFHKLLAKCVNCLRGRWENCWASVPASAVHLLDTEDVIDKLVYAATNPVKDGLVSRASEWPGVNTIEALLSGTAIRARRPNFFFRKDGNMPLEVSIKPELPAQMGDRDAILRDVRQRIAAVEAKAAADRATSGRTVMGRARILGQSWRESPTSHEPRRTLRPRLAAMFEDARKAAIERSIAFQVEYRNAWRALKAGTLAVFPAGTYWLRRFAMIKVAEAIPSPSFN